MDYRWHVASVLKGSGEDPTKFVHYVQRYLRPDERQRYTGRVLDRSHDSEAAAQRIADDCNAGNAERYSQRLTYL